MLKNNNSNNSLVLILGELDRTMIFVDTCRSPTEHPYCINHEGVVSCSTMPVFICVREALPWLTQMQITPRTWEYLSVCLCMFITNPSILFMPEALFKHDWLPPYGRIEQKGCFTNLAPLLTRDLKGPRLIKRVVGYTNFNFTI